MSPSQRTNYWPGERTIPRDKPISFAIINTQFLTKISTSILPVSIIWHNYCNIFLETRDLYSPHAPEFRCHSRGVTICSLFRDMTLTQDSGQRRRNVLCYCHWTTCRSYCSFCGCVWCHGVCRSVKKDKGQGFEIRTPVPSFFTRNFPRTYMPRSGHP